MIVVVTCLCGSVESLARNTLNRCGYKDWATIKINKGKEKSRQVLSALPQFPEIEMLDNYIKNASKWVVIIGYDENNCRWTDVAHNGDKSKIEAEFVVSTFA